MNSNIFPKKLKSGDEVRIIAPSCAKATLGSGVIEKGESELRRLGLRVSWGAHTHIVDELDCAPVAARVEDLHEAFLDPEVKAILAVRGGFYANQLLGHIDFSVIKNNPKIFCGFSDITVLQNAILARTGLVSYSGPNLSYIGKSKLLDYTIDYLRRCLFEDEAFTVDQALSYQNFGPHFGDEVVANSGWVPLVAGVAEGVIVGGNLCTFNLLQGTSYMPSLQNAVLFLEDDASSEYKDFDRNFQSLLHLPDFASVRGIVFGRFQQESGVSKELLKRMIDIRPELQNIPVLANVDFGHTEPKVTFPVGGTVRLRVGSTPQTSSLEIIDH